MPANNTNTRQIQYIGDDPELRKFIHKWDSINFEYEEDENEKILNPRCGYGYCIWRHAKDIIVKMPDRPYDGDMFAIMDITGTNTEYVEEHYYNEGKLIKETPVIDNFHISEGKIYVDNSYDYPCRTKVVYDDQTYQPGDTFQLDKTCCNLHVFSYSRNINAWSVKWIEKECVLETCKCKANAKVIIRFYDYTRYYGDSLVHEDVFDVEKDTLFTKSYKNYEIVDIFNLSRTRGYSGDSNSGLDELDVSSREKFVESLNTLASYKAWADQTYSNNTSSPPNFSCSLTLNYSAVSHENKGIFCTDNTVDGEYVYDFPFETGYLGEFFYVRAYAEYNQMNQTRRIMNHAPLNYYDKQLDSNDAMRNVTLKNIYNKNTNEPITDETLNRISSIIKNNPEYTRFITNYTSSSFVSYQYFDGKKFVSNEVYPIATDTYEPGHHSWYQYWDELTQPISFEYEYDSYSQHYETWLYLNDDPLEKLDMEKFFGEGNYSWETLPKGTYFIDEIFQPLYSGSAKTIKVVFKSDEWLMSTSKEYDFPFLLRPTTYTSGKNLRVYYQVRTPKEYKVTFVDTKRTTSGYSWVYRAEIKQLQNADYLHPILKSEGSWAAKDIPSIKDDRWINPNHRVYTFDGKFSSVSTWQPIVPPIANYYTIDHFSEELERFLNQETKIEFNVTGDETIINIFRQ